MCVESEGQLSKEEEFVPSLKMNQATYEASCFIYSSKALSRILSLGEAIKCCLGVTCRSFEIEGKIMPFQIVFKFPPQTSLESCQIHFPFSASHWPPIIFVTLWLLGLL